jgi:hypothetical protein
MSIRFTTPFLLLTLVAAQTSAVAAPDDGALFREQVRPFLDRHCAGCHNDRDRKGDVSFAALSPTIARPEEAELWQKISNAVSLGDMPPPEKPRPEVEELSQVVDWIGRSLRVARHQFAGEGNRTVLRRLNRYEYENTLRDLFHLDRLDVVDLIPEDVKRHAYDNNGVALEIGGAHLDGYLNAISAAVAKAGVWDRKTGQLAESPYQHVTKVYGLIPLQIDERAHMENVARHGSSLAAMPPLPYARRAKYFSSYVFEPKHAGTYRIRLKHYLHKLNERLGDVVVKDQDPTAKVKQRVVDVFRALPGSAEKPQEYELELYLTATQSVVFTVGSTPPENGLPGWYQRFKNPKESAAYFAKGRPDDEYEQALKIIAKNMELGTWAIMSEETEGPLEYRDCWPPQSHTTLYGTRTRREDVTEADALAALAALVPRAYRRPVSAAETAPYLDLVRKEISREGTPPHKALEFGLRTLLTSPYVLYLQENDGVLGAYALASRLSYFLWSSAPDDAMFADAQAGRLKGEALKSVVERMLDDPRSQALERRFLTLWLDLDKIDDTNPDPVLFPEFNDTIKRLMLTETALFFRELLHEDLSVLNLIDSDFTMLNEELARYYGIAGVQGYAFRKVALKPEDRRGGVLTHGSVLKVTANGTETSPVLRGVWLLDRILGTPVPPPPVAPPAITPDTRGAVTVREQLALHRNVTSCNACHRKIDPLGFALESYDPAGSFRTFYRTTGEAGEPVESVYHRSLREDRTFAVQYKRGRDVELGGQMPDGAKFGDIAEFKRLLLQQKELAAGNVVRQLLTYALGRELDFGDEAAVERILSTVEPTGYGLRSIVHQVTQSEPFQSK